MKHFLRPKNQGRIKNADAVGEAGNILCGDVMKIYLKIGKKKGKLFIKDIKFETFGCLPPDEEIVTNDGWKKISELRNDCLVLNSRGKLTRIKEKYVRDYEGLILHFFPFVSPYNSFRVTPEHPILCIKRKWLKSARKNGKSKWLRIDEKELLSTKPRYIRAIDVEEGDFLVFVINKRIEGNKTFSSNLMRLIGYYLSEGYFSSKGSIVAFSFHKKEKKYIEEVKRLIKEIVGKEPKERTRGNVTKVYICSRKLAKFLESVAGKYARKKALSLEILSLAPKKQWELIQTYFNGDGSLTRRRMNDTPTYRLATSSKKLAVQLQQMLGRCGIFSSIKKIKTKPSKIDGRIIEGSEIYSVDFKLKRKRNKFVRSKGKYFLIPVRKITKEWYKGKVYNLHVEGNPKSYLVKGFAVHNCVVAIANSSLLTEMVKGKTLDEVLKMKKDDLVKRLGKVPPIKIHCSVLALEALHEAIYNYLKKKGLPIPKTLERTHKRVEKIRKEIEERYEDFVRMEREMLGKND